MSTKPPLPGQGWLTPDYEFIKILGRGGTGWVALARHLPLDRLVAVKTMNSRAVNSAATARVQREGRILAGLRHPGIVTVYQLLMLPNSLSLVMEYLPGGDLGRAMDTGTLTGAQTVSILTQVAAALSAAATAGIVHRDIKPGNILLDGNGRAVVADFGLARLSGSGESFRTMAGTVTGTPLFMAPEQIDQPDVETPAIDSYAFGTLAYRLLTGEYPYPAKTLPEIIQAHRTAPPRPPSQIRRALPRNVCDALLGALDKNPASRTPPPVLINVLSRTPPETWNRILPRPPIVPTIPLAPSASLTPTGEMNSPLPSTARSMATQAGEESRPAESLALTGLDLSADPNTGNEVPSAGDGVHRGAVAFVFPEQESWIQPVVYQVPKERNFRWHAVVTGLAVGVLIGVLLYVLLIRV